MDPTIIITLSASVCIAIFSSITAPIVLSHRTERMHREDMLEQYRREDLVAKKAEAARIELANSQKAIADQAAKAAHLLLNAQRESIARTDEVARLAAATAASTELKLDQLDLQTKRIHTLVNSDMTAARQEQLDQTRVTVQILERVIALAVSKGQVPEPQDVLDLSTAKESIANLEAILADRMEQMRKVQADQLVNPIEENGAGQGGQ
jgi:hypothetical protein